MNTGTCLQGYIYKFKPSTYIVDEAGKLLLNSIHIYGAPFVPKLSVCIIHIYNLGINILNTILIYKSSW